MRNEERNARLYCDSIGADPDALVWGGYDTGGGVIQWLQSPRWTWYRGANPDWERPLTAFERAAIAQTERRG